MQTSNLRNAVNWIGIAMASAIAASIPALHLFDKYNEQAEKLELKASFIVSRVARHIFLNDDIWQYQLARLSALIDLPGNIRETNRTRIVDRSGKVVLEDGPEIDRPVLTRGMPIFVKGAMVGRIEVDKSLRPLLIETGLISILSILLGLTTYFVVRVLPLRALDRALDALEARNSRFDEALNSMPQGLCRFDASQRVMVFNNRYCEIYGLKPGQVKPGTTLQQILEYRAANGSYAGPVPAEYVEANVARVGVSIARLEEIQTLNDGKVIQVLRRPMPDGGWLATFEDITEKRKLEQENERNRVFLDLILDNVPAPIFVKEASERRYTLVNRAGEEFWGVPREAMIGKTAHDIFAPAEADLIDAREDQLLASDRTNIDERQIRTPGNGTRSIVAKRIAIRDQDGEAQYIVGVIEDVTERKRVEEQISHMARHDALTGLANRVVFAERVEEASARLRRHGEGFSVVMLDLDRFKTVNDLLGHPTGDALLQEVARRLKSSLRETDALARLGGDEFAIILTAEAEQRNSATAIAERIVGVIAEPFDIDGNKIDIGASIGIAVAPDDGAEPIDLVKKADIALYRAKAGGRNRHCFFDVGMLADLNARNRLESDLRAAIASEGLELHYQPVIDAKTGTICGVEALARWRHPELGQIPPDKFIPLAEQTGLILPLGEWALQKACADAAGWPEHIKVAVNLSPAQFKQANLVDIVICALVESGLSPQRLELEITETVILSNESAHWAALRQLKGLGVAIALDDFGTGYSSLSYLTMFPFDKVKIDKSFTQNMTKRASHAAIVSSTLAIGRDLGMSTTAEGVETKEQLEQLRASGVTFVQGWLFGKAVPADQLQFGRADGNAKVENAA